MKNSADNAKRTVLTKNSTIAKFDMNTVPINDRIKEVTKMIRIKYFNKRFPTLCITTSDLKYKKMIKIGLWR